MEAAPLLERDDRGDRDATGDERRYDAAMARLSALVQPGGVTLLTGAGLSTESGIPDYRGPTGRARGATPMTYDVFTGSTAARQRYWARSHAGWATIARAVPNAGHRAVAELGRRGLLTGLVTQNVDGLHSRAGSEGVIDLHGTLDRVVCLGCAQVSRRTVLDDRLRAANPGWQDLVADQATGWLNPDGDVALADELVAGFTVVDCLRCGGLLKPDVVFFGESVPRDRVDRSYELVAASRSLLVLGSSLTVMSGYRFVRYAHRHAIPVAILNQGATRGDAEATLLLDRPLGVTLTDLLTRVTAGQVRG